MFVFSISVTDLDIRGKGEFKVVLGKILNVRWTMKLGTNVSALFDWGDSSNKTFLGGLQANATRFLDMTVPHDYTREGEFEIKLLAYNVLNNQTDSNIVHVQVPLDGMNVSAPAFLVVNEWGHFRFTLVVVSLALPNVSWKFGDDTPTIVNKNFSLSHLYERPGNYSFKVIAANHVSKLTYSSVVIVQERISQFRFSTDNYKFSLNVASNISLLWSNGSHMSIVFNFSYGETLWKYMTLRDEKIGGLLLTHMFNQVGVFEVCASASNRFNNATACASVIVEIPVLGLDSSVVCNRRFKDCFQDDTISVNAAVTNGSNPHFSAVMGDGTSYEMTQTLSITHRYNRHGQIDVHISVYNNVSLENVTHSLTILEIQEIQGLKVECNRSLVLSNVTSCTISLVQGNAFECKLFFGDGSESYNYTHETLPANVSHKYSAYGTYIVKLMCNNTLGTLNARYKTVVTGPELGLSLLNNGPLMTNDLAVITMQVKNPAPKSCFLLDLGDGNRAAYGDGNCSKKYYGIEETLPIQKRMLYNNTYKSVGVFSIRFEGTDSLLNESVTSSIAITEKPCRILSVSLENVATTSESATRILKSRQFVIRSKYEIKCSSAVGAMLKWNIYKSQSGSFVSHSVVSTTTSSLVIEPRSTDYGVYKIELTLTLNGVEGILESTEGFIEVTKTPLSAMIVQGSAIRRSWDETIQLDGSESHDPDEGERNNSRLIFRWFCFDINETIDNIDETPLLSLKQVVKSQNISRVSCGRYREHFPGNTDPSIVLKPELLSGQKTVLVELEIEEGNRQARAFTLVQRVNSTVPSLIIK